MVTEFKRPNNSRAAYLNAERLAQMKKEAGYGRVASEWVTLLVDELYDVRGLLIASLPHVPPELERRIRLAVNLEVNDGD